MAAFAVMFHKNGRPASLDSANKMKASLRMFGRDRDHVVARGRFALSWTFDTGYTPQDRYEFQPAFEGDRWLLVFVGFLMHREELAEKLAISQKDLEITPDSALILAAWFKWKDDSLSHLYGVYSFVVCDTQQQKVVAVRGHERGINIYYHETSDRIILTTSTKAIFCFSDIVREIDETKICDMLVLNHEDAQRSYFKGVNILPGGNILTSTPDNTDIARFYSLDKVPDIRFAKNQDYVDAARELTENAIATSMRAIETPAVSLSAGLDSTAVALIMLDVVNARGSPDQLPIKAYVSVPDNTWDGRVRPGRIGDESVPIRALIKDYPDLDVEFVDSGDIPFDHRLDEIQDYADMPVRGVGNLSWGMDISEKCREAGHRVKFSGSSGNGTLSFSGASVFFGMWFRQGRWITLLREHDAFNSGGRGNPARYIRRLLGRAVSSNVPNLFHDWYFKSRTGQEQIGFSSFSAIHPDYAHDMDMQERMKKLNWDDRYRVPKDRREFMEILLRRGVRNENGGLSEAFKAMTGVQTRDPLGDRKLMEFCIGIPDEQFFKNGIDRRLIKQVMAGRLPGEILHSPRGEQSADWHGRMTTDLHRIESELKWLAEDPVMASRLDIERMLRVIRSWPDKTPLSAKDHSEYKIARYAIWRAISVARFINRVEGKNH